MLIRFSIISLIGILIASLVVLTGCKSTEIVYARATKFPEEANGFMRVASEDPILVNVAGTDFAQERSCAGYILIHEQDLAALVEAARK